MAGGRSSGEPAGEETLDLGRENRCVSADG